MIYKHYIAVDWSQKVMAIARMEQGPEVLDEKILPSDIRELKFYLKRFKGPKVLTVEESSCSQWLYTELREFVDELIVCDPYRNHLLKEGPKTDQIDARKLVYLLKANLLKPVFHSGGDFMYFRKLVSGYRDLVQAGVRLKNQRASLLSTTGKAKTATKVERNEDRFVLEGLDRRIEGYEEEKRRYEREFHRVQKLHPSLRHLKSLPGVGEVGAITIAAYVVEAQRFKSRQNFWSYCGLVKLEKLSGGRSYGRKNSRFCRPLKTVFKTAAITTIRKHLNNPLRDYYDWLIKEKNLAEYQARHAVARRMATLSFGVLKSNEKFEPRKLNLCSTVKV